MDQENPLSKAESDVQKLIEKMNEYLDSHGLKTNSYNVVVEKYLHLTPDQLNKMGADECGEAAYLLTQYSEYLQREVNQQQAIQDWAEKYIDSLVISKLDQYGDGFVKYEYKRACAIRENPLAKDLSKISMKAQNHLTSLRDLPYKIEKRADRLSALQATKRKRYDN